MFPNLLNNSSRRLAGNASLFLLFFVSLSGFLHASDAALPAVEPPKLPGIGLGIVVRTTENVTDGGWVWILNQCEALGVRRIDLLVKQDEDHFQSARTGKTLESGELLVPLPGETCAAGWENADWLKEMLARAKEKNIQVWAWWPCFHDAQAAARFPKAAYKSKRGEVFVDPAFPEVRGRQEELIAKLLETYPFNGVSLDWVRYEGWSAGKDGPLSEQFQRQYPSFHWSDTALENGYSKARWYEIRAKLLADWTGHLASSMRTNHPAVRWGAFLQPWQFTETSVSYPLFGKSGIDYLQPMGYWADWKLSPEWVGKDLLAQHAELQSGTSFWLTLGIDEPKDEMAHALAGIAPGVLSGISWFTYGAWEQKTFDRLRGLIESDPSLRTMMGYPANGAAAVEETPALDAFPADAYATKLPLKPMQFPPDTSVWSLICLAELYKTKALNDRPLQPVIPVIGMHTFVEGRPGTQSFLYKTTTDYLDALLAFIEKGGFHICPLSRLQSYLITRDPSFLPPRPLVITLDDGSRSVCRYFFPRAQKLKFPFTLAFVTSWLSETDESIHSTDERGHADATMSWKQAREINDSGLAEFVSHSDAMHYQTADQPAIEDGLPAETTRQYLAEFNRPETNPEYDRRIRLDMMASRLKFAAHGFRVPTILCWPYGEWNHTAKRIAEDMGFTHFLLFDTPPVIATAADSLLGIPRIPVLRTDELVPLQFPSNPVLAQSWWLAFLKVGRDSRSADLIQATLAQLTPGNWKKPAAELARAALDHIRGDAASGNSRLAKLRQVYAMDSEITAEADAMLRDFNPNPALPPAHP